MIQRDVITGKKLVNPFNKAKLSSWELDALMMGNDEE